LRDKTRKILAHRGAHLVLQERMRSEITSYMHAIATLTLTSA
jgi:hypothetical protein